MAKTSSIEKNKRRAKLANHIAVAAMDLSGSGDVADITAHLTAFADKAVQAALGAALKARGLAPDGLFIVALGLPLTVFGR